MSRPDLPTRTTCLIQRGDAYVVLPGGTGTLSELGLLLELIGKRHIDPRPLVLMGEFWMPLVDLMREEKVFRPRVDYRTVNGVELIGQVARADGPAPAVRFLETNLLEG
jgi:predicted Rossmann-fold nucleotide-binding protein